MVSLGLTTKEIEEQITNKVAKEQITKPVDFNSFFDLPHPRLIPQVCPSTSCDYEPRDNNGPEESLLVAYLDPKTVKDVIHSMKQGDNFLDAYQSLIFSSLTKGMDTEAILSSWIEGIDPPLSTLAAYWAPYLVYLNRDMGSFLVGRCASTWTSSFQSERPSWREVNRQITQTCHSNDIRRFLSANSWYAERISQQVRPSCFQQGLSTPSTSR